MLWAHKCMLDTVLSLLVDNYMECSYSSILIDIAISVLQMRKPRLSNLPSSLSWKWGSHYLSPGGETLSYQPFPNCTTLLPHILTNTYWIYTCHILNIGSKSVQCTISFNPHNGPLKCSSCPHFAIRQAERADVAVLSPHSWLSDSFVSILKLPYSKVYSPMHHLFESG